MVRTASYSVPPMTLLTLPTPTLALSLFIEQLQHDPKYFVSVVVTVVFSIVLHELGHGIAAIKLGDRTPIDRGHMTLNPIVHMGPFSLILLAVAGIAWGAMPIDPTRLRGRYAEAIVAAAGPAVNLLLAFVGGTVLGILAFTGAAASDNATVGNLVDFLFVFTVLNVALLLFNLLPVPPLDGSRILADFYRPYGDFVYNPSNGGIVFLMFPLVFMFSGYLFIAAASVANAYIGLFV